MVRILYPAKVVLEKQKYVDYKIVTDNLLEEKENTKENDILNLNEIQNFV